VLADLTKIDEVGQAAIALLEQTTFDTLTTFDALNRPISLTTPDQSIIYPILNEANLLEKVEVKLRGATTRTTFVSNINYDAKGQRQFIEYGNGVKTEYRYDPQTFRLIQLLTTRIDNNQPTRLQNLNYSYDPVGNITTIRDDSQQTNYFNGEVVSPSTQYQYDALYRLISASGREHIGQTTQQPPETRSDLKPHYDSNDWTRRNNLPHPNDAQAMRNYTETYEYDGVGNILAMIHQAMGGGWTRHYDYEVTNNRLRTTSLPGDGNDVKQLPPRYRYDLHGNMMQMPHLPVMQWDFKDQLHATSQQVRNDGGKPEMTYFVYDASGQRVRKITECQADAGQTPTRRKERIYLGGFEIYREYNGDGTTVTLERETLHIMDDQQRIALVETRTQGNDDSPLQLIRYQLGNHLGSASLELSDRGAIVSYEEYYPYGSTSYQGGRSLAEVGLKRYRYTGKERDEETGLAYHGARYYAAWLGRWTSCDPIGMKDGVDVYAYVRDNPVKLLDPQGTDGRASDESCTDHQRTTVASGQSSTAQILPPSSPTQLESPSPTQPESPLTLRVTLTSSAAGKVQDVLYNPKLSINRVTSQLGLSVGNWSQPLPPISFFPPPQSSTSSLPQHLELNVPIELNNRSTFEFTVDRAKEQIRLDLSSSTDVNIAGLVSIRDKTSVHTWADSRGQYGGVFNQKLDAKLLSIPVLTFRHWGHTTPNGVTASYEYHSFVGAGFGSWSLSTDGFHRSGAHVGLLSPNDLAGNRPMIENFARSSLDPYQSTQAPSGGLGLGVKRYWDNTSIAFGVSQMSLLNHSTAKPTLPFPGSSLENFVYPNPVRIPYGVYAGFRLQGSF
jgi:RHS repeat-associated protein